MQEGKYVYRWMSFSENEADLLETYINQKAQDGYEIRKIARFYLRFKKTDITLPHFYVQSYRRHYFGHLYWRFAQEPLPKGHSYGPRRYYHLLLLLLLTLALFSSIRLLYHLDARLLYSDAAMVVVLSLPYLCFSFFLDFLGRFWESWQGARTRHLRYAKFRALFLGWNMIFRYVILCALILPAFLKELRLPVVFVILLIAIYEIANYYLPHRFRNYCLVGAGVIALLVCLVLWQVQNMAPYQKKTVHYDQITMLRLDELLSPSMLDEEKNYVQKVHRYTSMSVAVPFYYMRQEALFGVREDKLYEVYCSISVFMNEDLAKYTLQQKLQPTDSALSHTIFGGDEIYGSDDRLLLRQGNTLYFYTGDFSLQDEVLQAAVQRFIDQDLEKALNPADD